MGCPIGFTCATPKRHLCACCACRAQQVVPLLLAASIGDRQYARAQACCAALREACVMLGRPGDWNAFLRRLQQQQRPGEQHHAFWLRLVVEGQVCVLVRACVHVGVGADGVCTRSPGRMCAARFQQQPARVKVAAVAVCAR